MTATVALTDGHLDEHVPICTTDPERWTTVTPDAEAIALCRSCPLRWRCAREAWETAGAEGLWAGVVIPEGGRPRQFALRQLRSLAEYGGYPVRPTRRARRIFIVDGD
jgi:WhiB family redox-sensing transcriptional regulator